LIRSDHVTNNVKKTMRLRWVTSHPCSHEVQEVVAVEMIKTKEKNEPMNQGLLKAFFCVCLKKEKFKEKLKEKKSIKEEEALEGS